MENIQTLHEQVKKQIETNNSKYKTVVEKQKKLVVFDVGDYVWAILTKDCYPASVYNKLSARKVGLCEVIEKINDNAY